MGLARIRRISDPRRRAEAAAEYLAKRVDETKHELDEIRDERNEAAWEMLALHEDGQWVYRYADVSRALGLSRATVSEQFAIKPDRGKPPT